MEDVRKFLTRFNTTFLQTEFVVQKLGYYFFPKIKTLLFLN